jgi:hypothetical protein
LNTTTPNQSQPVPYDPHSYYLQLTKKSDVPLKFNDGVFYLFEQDSKPKHVQFYVSSLVERDLHQEVCNVRLTSVNRKKFEETKEVDVTGGKDVFIFRIGYFNFIKLNF